VGGAGHDIVRGAGHVSQAVHGFRAPAGKRLFLEMADVHEYAKVKLNGKELEAHAWQPFRWEVTSAVKPGSNDLEVEVRTSGGRTWKL